MPATRMTLSRFCRIRKLSRLLTIAVADLLRAEKRKGVSVRMSCWVNTHRGTCYVCLAGASLLACRNWDAGKAASVVLTDSVWPRVLALNYLRVGRVSSAKLMMKNPYTNELDREVADYHKNRDQFFADMKTLIKDLRAAKL